MMTNSALVFTAVASIQLGVFPPFVVFILNLTKLHLDDNALILRVILFCSAAVVIM